MLSSSIHAQSDTSSGFARDAFPTLAWPTSARSGALGNAVTGCGFQAIGKQLNPAAWDAVKGLQADAMYAVMPEDQSHQAASVGMPIGGYVVAGLSYQGFGIGNIEARDDTGGLGAMFSYRENAITVSCAGRLTDQISCGTNIRGLFSSLQEGSAQGVALDLGALYRPIPLISFGVSGINLGSYLKWSTGTKEKLLPQVRAGTSLYLMEGNLILTADGFKTQYQPIDGNAGVEFFQGMASVRAGICYFRNPDIALGGGIIYRSLGIDYSWELPASDLGAFHRISLRYIRK